MPETYEGVNLSRDEEQEHTTWHMAPPKNIFLMDIWTGGKWIDSFEGNSTENDVECVSLQPILL